MIASSTVNPSLPDVESLSLAEQVAQMVVVRTTGHLFDHQRQYPHIEANAAQLSKWLGELGVGGVILLGGSAGEVGLRTQQLQSQASIPLLIAADIEEGVGQRFAGATWFPPPMALSAIADQNLPQALQLAEQMGSVIAREALAIGLNWILAPVVDVNNNPANPVINVRSFAADPEIVSQLATAFIRGAQQQPVLTTAKHFPGHGDTATDSHLELPVIPHDLQRLDQIELPPFRSAIAAGVDAVMTAHLNLPQLDPTYPATLSPSILTGMLRQEMGFNGLIVTDALMMGAIANRYGDGEAAVLAVEAGTDILLMPTDPEAAIHAVCDAVADGRLTRERIRYSVERLWRAKHKVGSALTTDAPSRHAWEHLPPPPVRLDQVAQPDALACATAISQQSMQSTQRDQALPIAIDPNVTNRRNVILVDQVLDCPFLSRTAPAIAYPRSLGYTTKLISTQDADSAALPATQVQTSYAEPTLLQIFIRGNPFRGSAAPTQLAQDWLQALVQAENLQALLIYGSPYAMDSLLPDLPEAIPYIFCYGQMPSAQRVAMVQLLGQVKIDGLENCDRTFTT